MNTRLRGAIRRAIVAGEISAEDGNYLLDQLSTGGDVAHVVVARLRKELGASPEGFWVELQQILSENPVEPESFRSKLKNHVEHTESEPLSPSDPWTVGAHLGRWILTREITRREHGLVFEAREVGSGEKAAVKSVPREAPAAIVARFEREIDLLRQVRHGHLLSCVGHGIWAGAPYAALEYAPNSLADGLGDGRLGAQKAAQLLAPVARAVGALHQQGIVHRDIKPSNILFRLGGVPVLADLGLAKRMRGDTTVSMSGAFLGTAGYAAPEQHRDAATVGPPSDVFSLGVTLYECLFADLPWGTQGIGTGATRALPRLPREAGLVPEPLLAIIVRCLWAEPERRYVSADALAEDIERFLAGKVPLATLPSRAERLRVWLGLNGRVVAISLALLLLGLVVGTLPRIESAWDTYRARVVARNHLRATRSSTEARLIELRHSVEALLALPEAEMVLPDLPSLGAFVRWVSPEMLTDFPEPELGDLGPLVGSETLAPRLL